MRQVSGIVYYYCTLKDSEMSRASVVNDTPHYLNLVGLYLVFDQVIKK